MHAVPMSRRIVALATRPRALVKYDCNRSLASAAVSFLDAEKAVEFVLALAKLTSGHG